MIEWAWNNEPPAIYGRFDISWSGEPPIRPPTQAPRVQRRHPHLPPRSRSNPVALAESHAPSPRLLETRPVQLHPRKTHRQVAGRRRLPLQTRLLRRHRKREQPEDQLTVTYLRDTAQQAGLDTRQLAMADIGWDSQHQTFVDLDDHPIFSIFKLYPGGHAPRRVRRPRTRDLHRCPLDRAHREDASLQQRHPPHPLGSSTPTTTSSSKPTSPTWTAPHPPH